MDFSKLQKEIKNEITQVFARLVRAIQEVRKATIDDFKAVDIKIDLVAHELEQKADEAIKIATETTKKEGPAGHTPTKLELEAIILPLIPAPIPGQTYVLTNDDKIDIAERIPVPVVKQEIIREKTEVVREVPIVTNEVKEVAKYENALEIIEKIGPELPALGAAFRDGLELLEGDNRLDAKAIKNLPKQGNASGGITKTLVQQMIADAGGGDVVGPSSATDNAIARYDTTTGKRIQNSGVTINDSDVIEGAKGIVIADPSASLGAERMSNPNFGIGIGSWTAGAAWRWSATGGGGASAGCAEKYQDGTTTFSQVVSGTPVSGQINYLTFIVTDMTVGNFVVTMLGQTIATITANGTYTFITGATSALGNLTFTPSNTARFKLDDISVKQISLGTAFAAIYRGQSAIIGSIQAITSLTLPNSTIVSPSTTGQIGINTTSGFEQIRGGVNSSARVWTNLIKEKHLELESPTAADSIQWFRTKYAITAKVLYAYTDVGTVTCMLAYSSTPTGSYTSILSGNLTATTGPASTNSFSVAAIPAGSYIRLTTSAIASSPTKFHADFEYEITAT